MERPFADADLPAPFAERRQVLRDAQAAIVAGDRVRAQELLDKDAQLRRRCAERLRG